MFRYVSRWVRHNGNQLWLERRFFWKFWFRYESFENLERKVEKKLAKDLESIKKHLKEHEELMAERSRIDRSIREARECREGYGPASKRSLNFFRPAREPEVCDEWKKVASVLHGKQTIGDHVSSQMSSVRVRPKDSFDGEFELVEHPSDIVGEMSFPVRRTNDSSNKRKGGQNQNN